MYSIYICRVCSWNDVVGNCRGTTLVVLAELGKKQLELGVLCSGYLDSQSGQHTILSIQHLIYFLPSTKLFKTYAAPVNVVESRVDPHQDVDHELSLGRSSKSGRDVFLFFCLIH